MSLTKQIVVRSNAALNAAVMAATGGETIVLATGSSPYALAVNNRSFSGEGLTIRPLTPDAPPTFTELSLNGVANVTVEGMRFFSGEVGQTRAGHLYDVNILNSRNVTLRDSDMTSVAVAFNDGRPGTVIGENAVLIRDSQDVTLEGNRISNYNRAIALLDLNDDVVIRDNTVTQLQSDGIVIAGGSRILIEDNWIGDFLGSNYSLSHVDMIQVWNLGDPGAVSGLTIRRNVLHSADGDGTQGIFVHNERPAHSRHSDVVITDNVIYNGHVHGIFVTAADRVTVARNTLLTNAQTPLRRDGDVFAPVYDPEIVIDQTSTGVSIIDNITARVSAPSSATQRNNVILNYDQPSSLFYYEKNIVNMAAAGDAPLAALQVLPGSILAGRGAGSPLSVYDATPDALTPLFTARPATGAPMSIVFDAALTAGPEGRVAASQASFSWDFGDGSTGQGARVRHTYADHGLYEVTLRVTRGGESASITINAHIADPVELEIAFSPSGIIDVAGDPAKLTYDPAKLNLAPGVDGSAYVLGDDNPVTIDRINDFQFSRDAFSLSFAMQRGAAADDDGVIFYLHKAMSLTLTPQGELSLWMLNSIGQNFRIVTKNAAIDDSAWRHVTVSYDAGAALARLYVDGELLGQGTVRGVTPPPNSWGLTLGHPWGDSFNGLIDEIRYSTAPATAAEAVASYKDMLAALASGGGGGGGGGDGGGGGGGGAGGSTLLLPFQPGIQHLGEIAVVDGDARLSGNAWAMLPGRFDVTAETVLYVTLRTETEGEIFAVGLQNGEALVETQFFKLGGTQSWGMSDASVVGVVDGATLYRIAVGARMTGVYDRLVLAADDDGGAAAVGVFGQVTLANERVVNGVRQTLSATTYAYESPADIVSYAPAVQDFGVAAIRDARTVELSGNAWKAYALDLTVTKNTVLYATFEAPRLGEIHAIGFETDDVATESFFFKLAGSQQWGQAGATKVGADQQTWRIPIGDFYSGDFDRLVFVNDDDARAAAISRFSDVSIVEETTLVGGVVHRELIHALEFSTDAHLPL